MNAEATLMAFCAPTLLEAPASKPNVRADARFFAMLMALLEPLKPPQYAVMALAVDVPEEVTRVALATCVMAVDTPALPVVLAESQVSVEARSEFCFEAPPFLNVHPVADVMGVKDDSIQAAIQHVAPERTSSGQDSAKEPTETRESASVVTLNASANKDVHDESSQILRPAPVALEIERPRPNKPLEPNPAPAPGAVLIGLRNQSPTVNAGLEALPDCRMKALAVRSQIIEHLVKSVKANEALSLHEVEIKLEPKELGEVWVKVSASPEGFTTEFKASTDGVRAIIQDGLTRLRQDLALSGLRVAGMSVGTSFRDDRRGEAHDKRPKRHTQRRVEARAAPYTAPVVRRIGGASIDAFV